MTFISLGRVRKRRKVWHPRWYYMWCSTLWSTWCNWDRLSTTATALLFPYLGVLWKSTRCLPNHVKKCDCLIMERWGHCPLLSNHVRVSGLFQNGRFHFWLSDAGQGLHEASTFCGLKFPRIIVCSFWRGEKCRKKVDSLRSFSF